MGHGDLFFSQFREAEGCGAAVSQMGCRGCRQTQPHRSGSTAGAVSCERLVKQYRESCKWSTYYMPKTVHEGLRSLRTFTPIASTGTKYNMVSVTVQKQWLRILYIAAKYSHHSSKGVYLFIELYNFICVYLFLFKYFLFTNLLTQILSEYYIFSVIFMYNIFICFIICHSKY